METKMKIKDLIKTLEDFNQRYGEDSNCGIFFSRYYNSNTKKEEITAHLQMSQNKKYEQVIEYVYPLEKEVPNFN